MAVKRGMGGLDRVLRRMNAEKARIRNTSKTRMRTAALFVLRESKIRTPVDTGNLKSGAGSSVTDDGGTITGTIYYQASYAPYVHERTELSHKAPGEAKFLEHALNESIGEVRKILGGEYE